MSPICALWRSKLLEFNIDVGIYSCLYIVWTAVSIRDTNELQGTFVRRLLDQRQLLL